MNPNRYISYLDYLMGREKDHPLTDTQVGNAQVLICAVNDLLKLFYQDKPQAKVRSVTSGYRPAAINAKVKGAAKKSAHMTCEAVDLLDTDREFGNWCLANLDKLEELGLYMEDLEATVGQWTKWIHLQTRKTKNRVFKP